MSRFFRLIAPCIYPSPVAHPIELPDFHPPPPPPPPQEKAPSKASEQQEPHVEETQLADTSKPVNDEQEQQPEVPISVLPVADFAEVVVPPTPTIPHLLPPEETEGMTSGAVQPPGSKGDPPVHEKLQHTPVSETEDSDYTDEDPDELEDEEDRLIYSGGAGIPIGPVRRFLPIHTLFNILPIPSQDGTPQPLLPAIAPHHVGRKCLVLDLDETLVHSSFRVGIFFLEFKNFAQTTNLTHHSRYPKLIMSSQSKLNFNGIMYMSLSDQASTIS
jgi:RNA polymerase II subunit A small phosphatase-like protein